LVKNTLKKEDVSQKKFKGPWSINYQEQFSYPICGKYVAQMFNSLFLSKIKLLFQKAIFTRRIARVSGEDK
jgi:hypothetical protein